MALRAVDAMPLEPDWSGVWTVDDLARWIGVNVATVYSETAKGSYDFARIPAGRAIRFSGPALAARFQIPGYGGGEEKGRD